MQIAVDCCSLLHAKAMARFDLAPLALLDLLAASGVALLTTTKIRGEQGASSLDATLSRWEGQGWLRCMNAKLVERKQVRNALRRRDVEPGDADKDLIAIARREHALLLTHDGPASVLARRVGVVDLVGIAAQAGIAKLRDVDAAWGLLAGLPWPLPATDWQGSVAATLERRGWRLAR